MTKQMLYYSAGLGFLLSGRCTGPGLQLFLDRADGPQPLLLPNLRSGINGSGIYNTKLKRHFAALSLSFAFSFARHIATAEPPVPEVHVVLYPDRPDFGPEKRKRTDQKRKNEPSAPSTDGAKRPLAAGKFKRFIGAQLQISA